MDNDIRIHLDEISPEDTARLARGCKRLYLKIMLCRMRGQAGRSMSRLPAEKGRG